MHSYINQPTKLLMDAIGEHIVKCDTFSKHPKVIKSFRCMQQISETVPSFISFVNKHTKPLSNDVSSRQEEIILIELYILTRVLSTYAAIPLLVSVLQLNGEFEAAAIINSNAIDEGGGKGKVSHHELLVTSLNIVAKTVGSISITTKLLIAAMEIFSLIKEKVVFPLDDESLWIELQNSLRYMPIHRSELPVALEISRLLTDKMLCYHQHIHKNLLAPMICNPHNKKLLAIATLELAKREAESVNEENGNLSFIGAWAKLARYYQDRIPLHQQKIVNAWAATHNEEEEARIAGWNDRSAEDGHARDARKVALHFLECLKPDELAEVLEQVNQNAIMRLQHWDNLFAALDQLRATSKYQLLSLDY